MVWRIPSTDFPQNDRGDADFDIPDESDSGKAEEEEYDDEPN